MRNLSFKRHRFPAEVITSSIWLYARFTLSLRDVEEMFAERGLDVSYETVRRWFLKFGPVIAAKLKRARPKPSDHWHLDEMAVVIRGQRYWLWRAVDNEGEVLDFIVQRSRDAKVAAKLMKKLLKRYEIRPSRIVTDELRSYRARVATSASPPSMTRACEPTIATCPSDDANANCSASNRSVRLSASCSSTPPPTIPSTTSVTCSAGPTTSSFGLIRSPSGLRLCDVRRSH
jgi:putative transposase